MIKIFVDEELVGVLPGNTNKEKFEGFLSLYLFNQDVTWKQIHIVKELK
jgi:hypothetical protein